MDNTFLAANTGDGFYSLFSEMMSRTDHNIYLIKGGPGTGKSSLMKKIAFAAADRGYEVEQMHCSSDPDSLDGIWVKEKKLIFLDATSPHCEDPKYPGAVEQILPLGELWDREMLTAHRQEIITLSGEISDKFKAVYNLLAACKEAEQMRQRATAGAYNKDKAEGLIRKLLRRNALVRLPKSSAVCHRFISALSGKGVILYEDQVRRCKEIVMIEDNYRIAHKLTEIADQEAKELGYDRIRLLDPLLPEQIDHLILPECSFAIITKREDLPWSDDLPVTKTINTKTLLDTTRLAPHKNKLTFVKKLRKALSDEVCQILQSEKALHDELEQIYIASMDFEALNRLTARLIEEDL